MHLDYGIVPSCTLHPCGPFVFFSKYTICIIYDVFSVITFKGLFPSSLPRPLTLLPIQKCQDMVEALRDQLTSYCIQVCSTCILQDAESHHWADPRPFYEVNYPLRSLKSTWLHFRFPSQDTLKKTTPGYTLVR